VLRRPVEIAPKSGRSNMPLNLDDMKEAETERIPNLEWIDL
jgi:hypothetical protein